MADSERETTARRVVQFANGDTLHKTINWASLAGVIATAALGYISDNRKGATDEHIKVGVARELAALREWKASATQDLAEQAEEIGRLREAAAALRATVDILARGRMDVASAAAQAGSVLEGARDLHPRARAVAEPAADEVQQLQKELFEP